VLTSGNKIRREEANNHTGRYRKHSEVL